MYTGDTSLILKYCREFWDGTSIDTLGTNYREEILRLYDQYRKEDFDVISFAYSPIPVHLQPVILSAVANANSKSNDLSSKLRVTRKPSSRNNSSTNLAKKTSTASAANTKANIIKSNTALTPSKPSKYNTVTNNANLEANQRERDVISRFNRSSSSFSSTGSIYSMNTSRNMMDLQPLPQQKSFLFNPRAIPDTSLMSNSQVQCLLFVDPSTSNELQQVNLPSNAKPTHHVPIIVPKSTPNNSHKRRSSKIILDNVRDTLIHEGLHPSEESTINVSGYDGLNRLASKSIDNSNNLHKNSVNSNPGTIPATNSQLSVDTSSLLQLHSNESVTYSKPPKINKSSSPSSVHSTMHFASSSVIPVNLSGDNIKISQSVSDLLGLSYDGTSEGIDEPRRMSINNYSDNDHNTRKSPPNNHDLILSPVSRSSNDDLNYAYDRSSHSLLKYDQNNDSHPETGSSAVFRPYPFMQQHVSYNNLLGSPTHLPNRSNTIVDLTVIPSNVNTMSSLSHLSDINDLIMLTATETLNCETLMSEIEQFDAQYDPLLISEENAEYLSKPASQSSFKSSDYSIVLDQHDLSDVNDRKHQILHNSDGESNAQSPKKAVEESSSVAVDTPHSDDVKLSVSELRAKYLGKEINSRGNSPQSSIRSDDESVSPLLLTPKEGYHWILKNSRWVRVKLDKSNTPSRYSGVSPEHDDKSAVISHDSSQIKSGSDSPSKMNNLNVYGITEESSSQMLNELDINSTGSAVHSNINGKESITHDLDHEDMYVDIENDNTKESVECQPVQDERVDTGIDLDFDLSLDFDSQANNPFSESRQRRHSFDDSTCHIGEMLSSSSHDFSFVNDVSDNVTSCSELFYFIELLNLLITLFMLLQIPAGGHGLSLSRLVSTSSQAFSHLSPSMMSPVRTLHTSPWRSRANTENLDNDAHTPDVNNIGNSEEVVLDDLSGQVDSNNDHNTNIRTYSQSGSKLRTKSLDDLHESILDTFTNDIMIPLNQNPLSSDVETEYLLHQSQLQQEMELNDHIDRELELNRDLEANLNTNSTGVDYNTEGSLVKDKDVESVSDPKQSGE